MPRLGHPLALGAAVVLLALSAPAALAGGVPTAPAKQIALAVPGPAIVLPLLPPGYAYKVWLKTPTGARVLFSAPGHHVDQWLIETMKTKAVCKAQNGGARRTYRIKVGPTWVTVNYGNGNHNQQAWVCSGGMRPLLFTLSDAHTMPALQLAGVVAHSRVVLG